TLLDRSNNVPVVMTRQIRVQPALDTDLTGPAPPRLLGPGHHLLQAEQLRIRCLAALGEITELTPHVTYVGEVDVAGDDKGRTVPTGSLAQPVRAFDHRLEVGPLGLEQPGPFGYADVVSALGLVQDLPDLLTGLSHRRG